MPVVRVTMHERVYSGCLYFEDIPIPDGFALHESHVAADGKVLYIVWVGQSPPPPNRPPAKLPLTLPRGTRILGDDAVATSLLSLEVDRPDAGSVYWGDWNGKRGWWRAAEIDWIHLATLKEANEP